MNNIAKFLKDMTYNTRYEFLDYGKHKDEIGKIAEKARIKLPAHDLAVFKCTYAYIDRQNLNGCTLLKGEVEKALNTLVGKAVDFDHMRKRVVGHWIDAKLEGDEIIAYGIFFKGNFQDDYDLIKDMMEKDVLAISFEAYGNREFTGDKSYNLRDIEFSGGALLIKTNPAFPGSEVLEMSQKERVLEFAKVMTEPKHYMHGDYTGNTLEEAQLIFEDIPTIYGILMDSNCPFCNEKGFGQIQMIDFEKYVLRVRCYLCDAIVKVDLKPALTLVKKGKKINELSITKEICGGKDMKDKEKSYSLNDLSGGEGFTVKCNDCNKVFQSDVRGESTNCSCGGSATTIGEDASKLQEDKIMKEKIEALEKELATAKKELEDKVGELQTATATIDELKRESEEAKVKIEEIEKTKKEDVEKAKTDATKIAERKSGLGEEFSKDVDLLDDAQYELAKTKKELSEKDAEIAELKKGKKPEGEKDLDKGSHDDEDVGDEVSKKSKKVRDFFLK